MSPRAVFVFLLVPCSAFAETAVPPTYEADAFRQLDELLPTPSGERLASGAPGPAYWQQRADYEIRATLDEDEKLLTATETITYTNNSPHSLDYLWIQLEQNRHADNSMSRRVGAAPDMAKLRYSTLRDIIEKENFEGGYTISSVTDGEGEPLETTTVDTMMRIDLPEPLAAGEQTRIKIDWSFNIIDADTHWARSGYEIMGEDKNALFTIAQWYPRLATYSDNGGWQNKAFLGRGEFALEFGDFHVELTLPADHIVAATGKLQNADEMLTPGQRERLAEAAGADKPVMIVTREEAEANEAEVPADGETKTWIFDAKNVRDFAWASSRKFLWDAVGTKVEGRDEPVMSMSYWAKEGDPLWGKYSTHAVAHTIESYSRHTIPYPYAVAISVQSPVFGMEYPMICFNGPMPEDDGTYSESTKKALISVIIHEVGHNWFPMIISSDERQWTWMDEGLNTYMQFIAESEWDEKYGSRRGRPEMIKSYMAGGNSVPIMTNSESLLQFGNNSYAKPAAALNILRETVMGRELFDFAFKKYCERWAFKHPAPADFFRTMEDASAVDLDWFWRGWFYTTKNVDIAISDVELWELDTRDPDIEKPKEREKRDEEYDREKSVVMNEGLPRYLERHPEVGDFYTDFDEFEVTAAHREKYDKLIEELEGWERELLKSQKYFYVVRFENKGGLPMPIILEVIYEDGEKETLRLPAEVWRANMKKTARFIPSTKKILKVRLDPNLEIADTDKTNNVWPPEANEKRFRLQRREEAPNAMREAKEAEDKAAEEEAAEAQKMTEEEKAEADQSTD